MKPLSEADRMTCLECGADVEEVVGEFECHGVWFGVFDEVMGIDPVRTEVTSMPTNTPCGHWGGTRYHFAEGLE